MKTGKNLPTTYKGYLTDELLKMWEQIQGDGIPKETPKDKILAMSSLLREHRLGMFANYPAPSFLEDNNQTP